MCTHAAMQVRHGRVDIPIKVPTTMWSMAVNSSPRIEAVCHPHRKSALYRGQISSLHQAPALFPPVSLLMHARCATMLPL